MKAPKPSFLQFLFMPYFSQAWQSLWCKPMIMLSLLPFACMVALWICTLTLGVTHFDVFIAQFPNFWVRYSMNEGVLPQIAYYLLLFCAVLTMLLCAVIVVGICSCILHAFLAPLVVNFVHRTSYPHIAMNPPPFFESLRLSSFLFLKTLTQFVLFSLCCYLLSFIGLGFIGLIIGVFLYFRFYCANLNHDVGISIMSHESYQLLRQYNKVPLTLLNIAIFVPLYIPIVNCFIATWQILVLAHFMFAWYAKNTTENEAYIEDAVIIE